MCQDQGNLTLSCRPNSRGIKERQSKLAWPVPGKSNQCWFPWRRSITTVY